MTNITSGEPFDDNGDTSLPLVSQDVASLMAKNEALTERVDRLESMIFTLADLVGFVEIEMGRKVSGGVGYRHDPDGVKNQRYTFIEKIQAFRLGVGH